MHDLVHNLVYLLQFYHGTTAPYAYGSLPSHRAPSPTQYPSLTNCLAPSLDINLYYVIRVPAVVEDMLC